MKKSRTGSNEHKVRSITIEEQHIRLNGSPHGKHLARELENMPELMEAA